MKQNYQKQLDAVIQTLPETGGNRLLLHSCCGPCSSYVLEYMTRFFDVTLLYYNPNIRPESEYEKRLACQRQTLEGMGLTGRVGLIETGWRGEEFASAAAGMEALPEGGARCLLCFRLRLEETARTAAAGGFDWFGTTLTVSPHKNAAAINGIGAELGEKYGVKWLPSDFKKREGYLRSIRLSGELGLYRQDYCGCTPGA